MSTQVLMPQMGESIAEGTVVRWIKKVGDQVDRDEPLFEISTDKVDAEIPSPAAGILAEIRVKEGETVAVNSVVATIGDGVVGGPDLGRAEALPARREVVRETLGHLGETPGQVGETQGYVGETPGHLGETQGYVGETKGHVGETPGHVGETPGQVGETQGYVGETPGHVGETQGYVGETQGYVGETKGHVGKTQGYVGKTQGYVGETKGHVVQAGLQPRRSTNTDEDPRKARSSPLVRKIAKEHNVDIAAIAGTGIGGRVTKQDILGFLDHRPAAPVRPVGHVPAFKPGEAVEIVPLGVMRKKIAEHMVLSRRTSAHVHSVFEVNFSRVATLREQKKLAYERDGVKLTFLTFIARAVAGALRAFPVINSSLDGDNIVYKKDVNLGVAVALDWGLIVPVVKRADEKNLLDLGRAIADLATRARAKQLKPEEVQGGTFTITNPGIFGAQFGMPIINQPQLAILGVGAIEKRAVVIDDAIAIRPMGYLTLGYDHRLIDGAVADQFLSKVKDTLERFDPAWV